MRLHRICGVRFRSHLRSYARAYAYRGLTAFASLSMAVSDRKNRSRCCSDRRFRFCFCMVGQSLEQRLG
ncbi:MAG: hypothetical protein ABW087_00085 [Candidatus Thiodiazotropha sp.]